MDAYSSAFSTSVRMYEQDVLEQNNTSENDASHENESTLNGENKIVMGNAADIFKRAAVGDIKAQTVLGE